ncbi:dimethylhistidine N-methyltransferase/ergothioneine biosynthesis protein EgtC,TIGR03442 [Actinokineospora alba]|uniref:Multifunctional fusion protein n=1 Tax=Actinokineospora alba TaxID=504798 RepID=A0A1H0WNU4_9PSEU|nr:dimethylhistidine N-methyltransferase/ergothioneine biosynthesis protein EgtC,TIGR03442 [Actinokineospora alba]SDI73506.1 dimethylhistidine N-methyltransferase/ergothioneine biosynthesis protein EgtC,TIGR03442 [Actinokineospora alba]SDP92347.1 dimethylhistidine N-methyltransferase/ergothioneine biosynthesis protein EgtC,TIGR03442 [Actinokineospora alba]
MCRHLGYLGPAVSLSSLLFDPPQGLLRQTFAPKDMRQGGTVNVDGFGVGWRTDGETVRYRRAVPMWIDHGFAAVAASTRSDVVLAAVRSATIGMPICDDACAPFTEGPWLFSHNGRVGGWPESVAGLAAELPTVDLMTLDAPTDSALIWALVRHRLRAGVDPADAVAEVARAIGAVAPDSRLNFLLTDGRMLVATTWWHSLSVLKTEDSVVLASEPWDDDPQWTTLGDHLLVTATLDPAPDVRVTELGPIAESPEGNAVTTTDIVVEVHLPEDHAARALAADVRAGLTATPKSLPPKWFYDTRGSELFEQITTLPEYYPTRAEREILAARAGEIASVTGAHTLVELGSGSSEKTRLLLDALRDGGSLSQIVVLDVSESALREASAALGEEYPEVGVNGVVGDFTEHLGLLPGEPARLVVFLGGTIGNLLPEERKVFLASIREVLKPGEWLLLGTDLVKDEATVVAAYDDAAGVTAEFNKNVLHVLNRELTADFDVEAFEHVALWDAKNEWIEMRLRSTKAQRARIAALDMDVDFAEGEELRTEISAKFRREGVAKELAAAGFALTQWWTDEQGRFALSLARAD